MTPEKGDPSNGNSPPTERRDTSQRLDPSQPQKPAIAVNPVVKSLRDFAFDSVSYFLIEEGFLHNDELARGFAFLANTIGTYQEEGTHLHPEILLCSDITTIAKVLPTHLLFKLGDGPIMAKTFTQGLKSCAPLAREHWLVYFEIRDDIIHYGLLAAGLAEPNPSPYSHLEDVFTQIPTNLIYMRSLGPKQILVRGKKKHLVLSFSLEEFTFQSEDYLAKLAAQIVRDVPEDARSSAKRLLIGLLQQSSEEAHGILIGVLGPEAEHLASIKTIITNAQWLPKPLNLIEYLQLVSENNDPHSQMSLRAMSGLARRMICSDGITIFSSRAEVLGFRCFVPSNDSETQNITGGARTKAFHKMTTTPDFRCAFFQSYDGPMKYYVLEGN